MVCVCVGGGGGEGGARVEGVLSTGYRHSSFQQMEIPYWLWNSHIIEIHSHKAKLKPSGTVQ